MNIKKMDQNQRKKLFFWGIISITFCIMCVLNVLTPMIADDYTYSFTFSGTKRIQNLLDIYESCMNHYNSWGGRILSHGMIYLLSIFPGFVFDLINSLVFVLFGIIIYRVIYVKYEMNPGMIMLIYITMFLCIPTFGQTALWFVGSVNYLWTMTVMTGFLVPYIWYLTKQKSVLDAKWGICFGFIGFLAGFCNENSSAATILGAILFVIYIFYKKMRIKAWMISGIVSAIIGWVIMIIAPGNKVRSSYLENQEFSLMFFKDRFIDCVRLIELEMKWLLIAVVILLIMAIKYKVNQDKIAIAAVLMLIAMASNFSMLFNPAGYSLRSFIATEVYTFIGGLILFYELKDRFSEFMRITLYVFIGYLFITSLIYATDSIFTTYVWHNQRAQYIEQEVSIGNKNIETYYIESGNPYSVFYGIEDLNKDKNKWTNTSFSRYHNLESIRVGEVKGR